MFSSDLIKNRPCFSLINFRNNVTAHQFILFFSMTNTAKKNSPASPGKAISLVKASTPPKKLKTNRSPLKSMTSARDQQIRYKEVGIEGVCLAFAFKPDGVHPSFMGPLIRALDEDEDQKSAGNILFLTQARHSNGSNTIAQTPSMTGKMYPTDVIVMSIDDENKTFVSAVDDLIKVLHNVATSDNCRGSWQFSIPTFVNKGSATPPSVPAMSTISSMKTASLSSIGFMNTVIQRNSCAIMSTEMIFWKLYLEKQIKVGLYWKLWQMMNMIFSDCIWFLHELFLANCRQLIAK